MRVMPKRKFVLKEELITWYRVSGEGISRELFNQTQVALPCECREYGCFGWIPIRAHSETVGTQRKLPR